MGHSRALAPLKESPGTLREVYERVQDRHGKKMTAAQIADAVEKQVPRLQAG